MARHTKVLLAAGLLAGCSNHRGSPSGLDEQTVTEIPPGSARGSALSGEYEAEIVTVECSGACGPIDSLLGPISLCDVGNIDDEAFETAQDDGALVITGDSSLYVQRQEGGIDADGAFTVGGYATENAGALEMTSRVEGTIAKDGSVDALARVHVWGAMNQTTVDCFGTYEVTADLEP